MTATPARRRMIVRDQRRPRAFLVPRYNEAQSLIVRYLESTEHNPAVLLDGVRQLQSATADTPWERQRNALCTEALQAFLEMAEQIPTDFRFQRAPQRPPLLSYGDVAVSVRPELIVYGTNRALQPRVGALKLYFSKTTPLSAAGGTFAATALADFSEQYLTLEIKSDASLCLVVDVFARTLYRAPRFRKRRRVELLAACDEIARAWGATGDLVHP
jgi:hypothetical protein